VACDERLDVFRVAVAGGERGLFDGRAGRQKIQVVGGAHGPGSGRQKLGLDAVEFTCFACWIDGLAELPGEFADLVATVRAADKGVGTQCSARQARAEAACPGASVGGRHEVGPVKPLDA